MDQRGSRTRRMDVGSGGADEPARRKSRVTGPRVVVPNQGEKLVLTAQVLETGVTLRADRGKLDLVGPGVAQAVRNLGGREAVGAVCRRHAAPGRLPREKPRGP